LESEVFILLQQKILGSLEHMQATHMNSEFVLSAKRGKKPTVIIATMRQTRMKSIYMTQVGRPVNMKETIIATTQTFMVPSYIEFNCNYFETNKEVTT